MSSQIRIMSFNILSDAPIWKKKWAYIKKEPWIYWDYRKTLILKRILDNDPDIMCLTECEYNKIDYFSRELSEKYYYIYTSCEPKKSQDTIEKYSNYSHVQNPGILIMFKKNIIRLINNHALNYDYQFRKVAINEKWEDIKLNHFLKLCVSNMILFENIKTEKRFFFVGLHHFNDPNYGDVKYYQMYLLLEQINESNKYYNYPVIMCGDFNAIPNSGVIYLIKNNVLNESILYDKGYGIGIDHEKIKSIGLPISIHLSKKFKSVYESVKGSEPKYTLYTEQFKDCIDYIFVTNDVTIVGVKDVDKEIIDWIKNGLYMPNEKFPSDHIDLVVNIQF